MQVQVSLQTVALVVAVLDFYRVEALIIQEEGVAQQVKETMEVVLGVIAVDLPEVAAAVVLVLEVVIFAVTVLVTVVSVVFLI